MAIGNFPVLAGMQPAPKINFPAMAAIQQPNGGNAFYYLAYSLDASGNMTAFWWVDAGGNKVPGSDGRFDIGAVVNAANPAYLFGRPGTAQQGWVYSGGVWYQGWPFLDSYGFPVANLGGPNTHVVSRAESQQTAQQVNQQQLAAAAPQNGANMQGNISGSGTSQAALLRELLGSAPVISAFQADVTAFSTKLAAEASITDECHAVSILLAALAKFGGAQSLAGGMDLGDVVSGSALDALSMANLVSIGPAAVALLAAVEDARGAEQAYIGAVPTAAEVATVLSKLCKGIKAFAVATESIAGSIFSGAATGQSNGLALVALMGGFGGSSQSVLPQKAIMAAAILGPQVTSLGTVIDTATTALDAGGVSEADVKTQGGLVAAAIQAWLAAVSSSDLFGAIGG